MRTLKVELGDRSYPIHIGAGIRKYENLLSEHLAGGQVMIVTNDRVAPLYLDDLESRLADFETASCVLPDGEQHKNLASIEAIVTALLEAGFDRSCTLIALGGGVVGDIAGFAAACYQRGVAYVQMPSTLLAQVDSAVGGKTAVNHRLGKNMIGAFHQPRCVLADTEMLTTLAEREISAGLAEVIKYGLIADAAFFVWLEEHIEALRQGDPELLAEAIERSCANKAAVVAADETERGARALLNLGHTFGHAVETGLGYGKWLHGEAVGAGCALAADLSARLGWLSTGDRDRIETLLRRAGLPTRLPAALAAERMLELMARDKKAHAGRIRLVLLRGIGKACVTADYDAGALHTSLQMLRDVSAVA